MKKFCTSLKEHAKNIIDFEKRKMLPLTKEELKSHEEAKACYICGEEILKKFSQNKNYRKIVIIQVNIEPQHIVFVI